METLTTLTPQQCLFHKRKNRCDPFEYVDGHYVGNDGFVVPNNFPEFYERFPDHIRRWVKRHADRRSSNEDIDDWTQDLCAHMSSLPATSNYRRAAKQDVIQTFDPFRQFGASLPRFLNYVNRCLANRFRTIHTEHMRNPLSRAEPLLCSQIGEEASSDDELCELLVEKLKAVHLTARKRVEDKLFVTEFVEFVRIENPRLVSVLGTMAVTATQTEAARKLGATGAEVERLYRQIRKLGRSFLSGKRPTPRNQRSAGRYETKANASTGESLARPARPSPDLNSTCWNRVDLYNEVWNQPLVKLSRKYGISDVRLGKVCRKLKIPHPGRGYWARKTVGQSVKQVPLSEFTDAPLVRRLKTKAKRRSVHSVQLRGEKDWLTGS